MEKETKLGSVIVPVLQDRNAPKKSTMGTAWAAVFTLCNACVGAGVLAYPNVFSSAGLLLTFGLVFVIGALEVFTLSVLAHKAQQIGTRNYQSLVYRTYGPVASVMLSITIFSYMFGALIAYMIITGDMLEALSRRHLGDGSIFSSFSFDILVISVAVLLPVSLKRNLNSLRHVSLFSLLAMVYLIVAVAIRSVQSLMKADWHFSPKIRFLPEDYNGLMNAIPVISFAFVCHLQICEVACDLDNKTSLFHKRRRSSVSVGVDESQAGLARECTSLLQPPRAFRKTSPATNSIIVATVLICAAVYSFIGAIAYVAEPTKWIDTSDLLKGYSVNDNLMEVGRVALAFAMMAGYPVQLNPCRSAVMDIIKRCAGGSRRDAWNDDVLSAIVTVCLVASSYGMAVSVRNLASIFKFIGGTVGGVLIFSIPGMMQMSYTRDVYSFRYLSGLFLFIFGIALLASTVVSYFV